MGETGEGRGGALSSNQKRVGRKENVTRTRYAREAASVGAREKRGNG